MGIQLLGYAATFVVGITQIPQLLKVLRSHDTEGLSKHTYALIFFGSLLWVPYAFAIHSVPVAITNIWLALVSATILLRILWNEKTMSR